MEDKSDSHSHFKCIYNISFCRSDTVTRAARSVAAFHYNQNDLPCYLDGNKISCSLLIPSSGFIKSRCSSHESSAREEAPDVSASQLQKGDPGRLHVVKPKNSRKCIYE